MDDLNAAVSIFKIDIAAIATDRDKTAIITSATNDIFSHQYKLLQFSYTADKAILNRDNILKNKPGKHKQRFILDQLDKQPPKAVFYSTVLENKL